MEWVIIAVTAVVGTLLTSLVYYFVVGPKEHDEGVEDEKRETAARAEGLKRGAAVVEEWKRKEQRRIDEKLVDDKKRDTVKVANELIEEFKRNKS
jgi:hypothetical protein